jgi:hypothetical protein
MAGSWKMSSSLNERKFLGGNDTLQIKIKASVRHTIERTEWMHINASGQLTHSQGTSLSVSWQSNQYWNCEHAQC